MLKNSRGLVHATQTKSANSKQLFDLLGNVEEWVTSPAKETEAHLIGGSFQSSLEELDNLSGQWVKKNDAIKRPTAGFRCVKK